jgi:tripartite-type tricarboxylate transporter receptor subunit TctC
MRRRSHFSTLVIRAARVARFVLAAACFALGLVAYAYAQTATNKGTYPKKPILIIVPFALDAADVFIRAIAPALESELGQPVAFENRPRIRW